MTSVWHRRSRNRFLNRTVFSPRSKRKQPFHFILTRCRFPWRLRKGGMKDRRSDLWSGPTSSERHAFGVTDSFDFLQFPHDNFLWEYDIWLDLLVCFRVTQKLDPSEFCAKDRVHALLRNLHTFFHIFTRDLAIWQLGPRQRKHLWFYFRRPIILTWI